MKHIMIDLETLGTTPGCAILSIGAVEFNTEFGTLGKAFYMNADLQSCLDAGLTVEGDTFYWWLMQNNEARSALAAFTLPIYDCLFALADWVKSSGADFIWSHGASFDLAVLSYAFKAVGVEKPWPFRQERDTRTLLEIVDKKMPKIENAHHALHDAKNQAMTIMDAIRELGYESL